MRLSKWLLCLIIMIQIGKNAFIQPGEVVAVVKSTGESVHVVLQGGSKVYTDWPIEKVLAELFDKELLRQQLNPFGRVGLKAENEEELLKKIRKYNKDTIFEPVPETDTDD